MSTKSGSPSQRLRSMKPRRIASVSRWTYAAGLHLGADQVGNLAAIKDVGAGVADELQRPREVGLSPRRSRRRRAVVYEELRAAGRELREQLAIGGDVAAPGRVDHVALREPDRRGDHRRPGQ